MGYRRSKASVDAAREWSTFVARNKEVIEASGLPSVALVSVDHWDDLLRHGYLDHHDDPTGFTVDQISEEQYGAFVRLVESYFVSGYEYFTPLALKDEDLKWFDSRFR
jgi:hypothetical protein